MNKKSFTVTVEGNLGSGKSTFLNYFSQCYPEKVEVIPEPLEKWTNLNSHNVLKLMYENPQRFSFLAQSYIYLTMLENHHLEPFQRVKLMERSLFSARFIFSENLFKANKLQDCELSVLDEWFKYMTNESSNLKVDLIIYLRTTPEKAFERVKRRAREEESGVTLKYLQQLHSLYEDWLVHKNHFVPAPVLILNADQSLFEMKNLYRKHEPQIFGEEEK